MPKYKITFKHVQEVKYITEIEADSIFDDDPFGNETKEIDVQGLDIKVESIEKV